MSTVARKARPFTCELEDGGKVARINGTAYGVEFISPGEDGTAAVVLHKADGDCYAVIRQHDGIIACDCPDYECNRRGITTTPCKHGRAANELGLLEAPASFADELVGAVNWDEYGRWSASLDGTDPKSWPAEADADRWVSVEDREWAAEALNADTDSYCLAGQSCPPVGLTVEGLAALEEMLQADRAAAEAEMQDRIESGVRGE